MKKCLVLIFSTLTAMTASAGGMWQLVNQQYAGTTVYCTYQLQGTTIKKTIQGMGSCQQFIFEN